MEILKQRILKDGKVKEENVLKVDSFLNHQMDIRLLDHIIVADGDFVSMEASGLLYG